MSGKLKVSTDRKGCQLQELLDFFKQDIQKPVKNPFFPRGGEFYDRAGYEG
jgi:hypothetical protein